MSKQRLELTWFNKDQALIPTEQGRYGYRWVDPSDPRYCETRPLIVDEVVRSEQTPKSDAFVYSERADLGLAVTGAVYFALSRDIDHEAELREEAATHEQLEREAHS